MKYDEVKEALIEARANINDSCQFCDKWDEINGCDIGGCEAQFSMQTVCDTLESLINKIENGTLVELPCKVGDTAWYIINRGQYSTLCSTTVCRICIDSPNRMVIYKDTLPRVEVQNALDCLEEYITASRVKVTSEALTNIRKNTLYEYYCKKYGVEL